MTGVVVDLRGLPVVGQFSEEGFVDNFFKIVDRQITEEFIIVHLRASHDDQPVGLRVQISRAHVAGFTAEMKLHDKSVLRPGVIFESIGEESDRLLTSIAQRYGAGGDRVMVKRFAFTSIALHNEPFDFERDQVRIKCFGCDTDEEVERELYFESFFNINLAKGFVAWNEKDGDYRTPLLGALSDFPASIAGDEKITRPPQGEHRERAPLKDLDDDDE